MTHLNFKETLRLKMRFNHISWIFLVFFLFGCGFGLSTSSTFNPDSIAGLRVWLNPVYFGNSGTSGDTDLFTTFGLGYKWASQSSSYSALLLGNGAVNDPIYRSSTCPNGYSAVEFATTSRFEDLTFSLETNMNGFTAFVVGARNTDVSQTYFSIATSIGYGGADQYISFGQSIASATNFLIYDGANTTDVQWGNEFGWRRYTILWEMKYLEASVRSVSSTTSDEYIITSNNGLTSPNGLIHVGGGQWGFLNGSICEMLIYNRALGDNEIVLVEDYLQYKFGF